MAIDDRTLAELEVWLQQYSAASAQLRTNAAIAAEAAWAGFGGWYEAAAVAAVAAETAALSSAAQQTTTGAAGQYVEAVVGALAGVSPRLPSPRVPPIRNGADMRLVHARPAKAYREAIATGADPATALRIATNRAAGIIMTDVSLAERATERDQYAAAGVKLYRRVLRPELSESGSCGLCIVAADQVYRFSDLLPIHPPSCKCRTMPITDAGDPGLTINREDLKALYAAAGGEGGPSTSGVDLKRVRGTITADGRVKITGQPVKVRQHGEHGPVLTRAGDNFRGPESLPLDQDPARAARMLEKVLPVLDSLEQRAAAGEDVATPLRYQRDLAERLRRITSRTAA